MASPLPSITEADIRLAADAIKFIRNSYTRARGAPVLLRLSCARCDAFVCLYQKDGKGRLLRLYRDRIHYPLEKAAQERLICDVCGVILGTPTVYALESRDAIHLFRGAVRQVTEYA